MYVFPTAVDGTLRDTIDDAELPDATVTQDGLNVILQPTGTTDTEKLTDPLNPPRDDTVTFTILDEGTFTLMVEGEAEMEKPCVDDGSGDEAPTLTVTVAEWLIDPLAAVTVIV